MKKIVLKSESCIGCGACVGIDSEHFEFNDDGFSTIISQENLDSPALNDAIDACPVAIISLEEISEDNIATSNQDDSNSEDSSDKVVSLQKESCNSCENEACHCHDDNKKAA